MCIFAAKFKHKVPGTTDSETLIATTVITDKSTTETTTVTTQSGAIHDQTTFVTNLSAVIIPPSTEFIESDRLSTLGVTSIVLVIVGGVTILISTVIVCAVVLFRKFNGRKSSNKAAQQQNEGIMVSCMQVAKYQESMSVYILDRSLKAIICVQVSSQKHNIIDLAAVICLPNSKRL